MLSRCKKDRIGVRRSGSYKISKQFFYRAEQTSSYLSADLASDAAHCGVGGFGERGFLIQYTLDERSFSYFTKESKFILPYDERIKKIKIIPSFENKKDVQGTPYEFDL